jgi:hypothetical protein
LIFDHPLIGSGDMAGAVDEGAMGLLDGLDLNEMFGAALGLAPPWRVTSVEFDQGAGRLDLGLDFPRGARFACPEQGCAQAACAVHDTAEKTWRHLDFFEHHGERPNCIRPVRRTVRRAR